MHDEHQIDSMVDVVEIDEATRVLIRDDEVVDEVVDDEDFEIDEMVEMVVRVIVEHMHIENDETVEILELGELDEFDELDDDERVIDEIDSIDEMVEIEVFVAEHEIDDVEWLDDETVEMLDEFSEDVHEIDEMRWQMSIDSIWMQEKSEIVA